MKGDIEEVAELCRALRISEDRFLLAASETFPIRSVTYSRLESTETKWLEVVIQARREINARELAVLATVVESMEDSVEYFSRRVETSTTGTSIGSLVRRIGWGKAFWYQAAPSMTWMVERIWTLQNAQQSLTRLVGIVHNHLEWAMAATTMEESLSALGCTSCLMQAVFKATQSRNEELVRQCCEQRLAISDGDGPSLGQLARAFVMELKQIPKWQNDLWSTYHPLFRPGIVRRRLAHLTATSSALVASTHYLYVCTRRSPNEHFWTWLERGVDSYLHFQETHIWKPIHEIFSDVFFADTRDLRWSEEALMESRNSLKRMITHFAEMKLTAGSSELKNALELAQGGRMDVVMESLEHQISRPIWNSLFGDLGTIMLIQLQKLKVDVEAQMKFFEDIKAANHVNTQLIVLVPAMFGLYLTVVLARRAFQSWRYARLVGVGSARHRAVKLLRSAERKSAALTDPLLQNSKDGLCLLGSLLVDLRLLDTVVRSEIRPPPDILRTIRENIQDLQATGLRSSQRERAVMRLEQALWMSSAGSVF